jgi:hypothetical protein
MGFPVQPLDLLGEDDLPAAAHAVRRYYTSYAGRLFDRIACESPPGRYTAADLYAVGALSAEIEPHAGVAILEDESLNELLAQVPADCTIADPAAASALADDSPAAELYARLRRVEGLGPTRVSKLLAAKRPALVPIRDSYVETILGAGRMKEWWHPMVEAWAGGDLGHRVTKIREHANQGAPAVPDYVTDLRLLDVALWMQYEGRG